MPNSAFLETYPLYRKFKMPIRSTLDAIPKVPVKMRCEVCGSEQTFLMANDYYESTRISNMPSAGQVLRLAYTCASCKQFQRFFVIRIDEKLEYVIKVGQFPAWEIEPDKELIAILGTHQDKYKKGLVCESQGYGIASFSYYRRIVEDLIDTLLDDIVDLLPEEGREEYLGALELTKKTIVTQEKIDLVKDLLPAILRPQGMNPLSALHSTLSEGLHAESDERCIELAVAIREVLVFLVHQISVTKSSSASFTESMKRLLAKKVK